MTPAVEATSFYTNSLKLKLRIVGAFLLFSYCKEILLPNAYTVSCSGVSANKNYSPDKER